MYLDWNKNANKKWVVDTEGNDLKATQFWCAVASNLGTNEELVFGTEAMYDGRFKRFAEDKSIYIVGHNFISWDSHWLRQNKIADIPIDRIIDSLVLSYLYNPYLPDGHSLEAYGNRFGVPKIGHDDWSHYSPKMLERCRRDVKINVLTYKALCKRMLDIGYSDFSCWIEHHTRKVIDRQERYGVWYDQDNAKKLIDRFNRELKDLEEPILKLFPPTLEAFKTYSYRTKKDGSDTNHYLRHQEESDAVQFNEDGSEYTTYFYKPFNIGSHTQRIDKLLSLGWIPTEFTEKTKKGGGGNPKVDADTLEEFAKQIGDDRVRLIADWLVRSSRRGNVEGLIRLCGEDGRLHGKVFTCGANSRRMRHADPNPTLTPRLTSAFGQECRELWGVEDKVNRCLVGYDASGLEMRMFGHYMGGSKEIVDLYVNSKPHKVNADAMQSYLNSEVTTDHSKKSIYSLIYGAYDKRLGNDYNNGGMKVGAKIRKALMKSCPGLEEAMNNAQDEWNANGGLIRCIDGGYVRCPSDHSALNYKLQPAGAITMKLAAIKLDKWIIDNGLDSHKCLDCHDESQLDTDKQVAEAIGKMGVQCIKEAGEQLGFCIPLTGEFSIGENWSLTH